MMTSRNKRFLKGGFSGLMIAAAILCGASAAQAAGTLPAGYMEVACITVTNQEQYINTGFQPYWMTDIEAHFSVPNFSGQNILYWTRTSGSFAFITKANTADPTKTNKVRAYRSSDGSASVETVLPDYLTSTDISYSTKFVENRTDNTFTVNGQKVDFVPATGTGRLKDLFLFRLNDNGSLYSSVKAIVGMKLYSFKIIEGGVAVANLVPCVNSDSVAGLYDTVRNAFYPNSGTGGSFGYETLPSTLDVASSSDRTGTPSPAYGRTMGLSAGQSLAASCGDTPWTNAAEGAVYVCTGWKLYDKNDNVVSSGTETTFTYEHPSPADYRRLEWQWVKLLTILPIPDQINETFDPCRPELTVSNQVNGTTWTVGGDLSSPYFDVAYTNNFGAGTATATVTGKGDFDSIILRQTFARASFQCNTGRFCLEWLAC